GRGRAPAPRRGLRSRRLEREERPLARELGESRGVDHRPRPRASGRDARRERAAPEPRASSPELRQDARPRGRSERARSLPAREGLCARRSRQAARARELGSRRLAADPGALGSLEVLRALFFLEQIVMRFLESWALKRERPKVSVTVVTQDQARA